MNKTTKEDTKPVHRIRSGALSVSIWEQTSKRGTFFTMNLQRAYTDDDGATWKHSDSLGRDDAPVAASLLTQAHAWVCRREQEKTI